MNDLILLCATDVGAAKNIAILAEALQAANLACLVVVSEISRPIFADSIETEKPVITSPKEAISYLSAKKPKAIICGTTRYTSPDRLLVEAAAKQFKIKSLVVLDEWFNYALRFGQENGRFHYLPDIICCQDERAKEEAIEAGIPAELLFVTGSLYLTHLAEKARSFLESPPELPDYLVGKAPLVITFLSETQAVDYGNARGEKGSLGDFIGYSEHAVRDDIFDLLKKLQTPCTVIEKLHPGDQGEYVPLNNEFISWDIVKEAQLWPLLWHSDLVIGMRSIALLEATILGRTTISYQPHLIGPQLCSAVRLNLVQCIQDKEELFYWIKENFGLRLNKPRNALTKIPFAQRDAVENIIDLITKDEK